jgi:fructose-1,6-bisphosphatase I
VNEANQSQWEDPVRAYFESLRQPNKDGKPAYSSRYIGSMVADVHRTLLYGGIFAYPADAKSRKGKLRLLYECFPMSFLVEQAGGKALSAVERLLDVVPAAIHDRSAIVLGSPENIDEYLKFVQ